MKIISYMLQNQKHSTSNFVITLSLLKSHYKNFNLPTIQGHQTIFYIA
jgi:hypothetical protein